MSILWSVVERPHDLNESCSRHFTWRSLVVCGPTFHRLTAEGEVILGGEPREREMAILRGQLVPRQLESWRMLAGVAQNVLDQVVDEFGPIELTYGFAGPTLTKHIKGCIAPHLDQHAAHELNQRRHPVCRRGGAAVDIKIPGRSSRELVEWLRANIAFDRIYYYGPRRSVHVSWQPLPAGLCWAMVRGPSGRLLPRPYALGEGTKGSATISAKLPTASREVLVPSDVPSLTEDEERAIRSLQRVARRWPPSLMLWGGGSNALRVMKGHPSATRDGCEGCTVARIANIPHDGGDPDNSGHEPDPRHAGTSAKRSAKPTTRRGVRHVD